MGSSAGERRGGRGGRRAGAGRPHTYRRITLDDEAAEELGEVLRRWRERTPQARWTGPAVVAYLITEAYARELRAPPDSLPTATQDGAEGAVRDEVV